MMGVLGPIVFAGLIAAVVLIGLLAGTLAGKAWPLLPVGH
mgnify:CR=1 FL=1